MLNQQLNDAVGVIELARPERRNALNVALCDLLRESVTSLVDDGARVIVITGQGTSFCSGADLDAAYDDEFLRALYGMLETIRNAAVPVIAAVNGPAIGAGTQLAIACDLRIASESAVFAVPTAKNGLAVDPWTVRSLASLIGGGPARLLLIAAGSLSVTEAASYGLVQRIGSVEDALEWAAQLAELAPLSVAYSKRVLNDMDDEQDRESEVYAQFKACFFSEDVAEARAARSEKRTPLFRGK